MNRFLKNTLCSLAALGILCGTTVLAKAAYPEKPITVIAPFGAGGDCDLTARVWAEFASRELGQPVIVVNKTGGGGIAGTVFAARSKADGYTLMLSQAAQSLVVPQTANTGVKFDSFTYVARFLVSNSGVMTYADAPWKNLREFADDCKANPGKNIYISPAPTSWLNLVFRSWMVKNDIKTKIVDYTAGGEATTAVVGKHGDVSILFPVNFKPMVDAKKAKLLAVGLKSDEYPDVPSFEELGYPGDYTVFAGIAAPKGTPREIIEKLSQVTEKITKNPEFIHTAQNMGFTPAYLSSEEWTPMMKQKYDEIGKILGEMNLLAK